jgi:hypothetical protein
MSVIRVRFVAGGCGGRLWRDRREWRSGSNCLNNNVFVNRRGRSALSNGMCVS